MFRKKEEKQQGFETRLEDFRLAFEKKKAEVDAKEGEELGKVLAAIQGYKQKVSENQATEATLKEFLSKLQKIKPEKLSATDKTFSKLKASVWGTSAHKDYVALVKACEQRLESFKQLEQKAWELEAIIKKVEAKESPTQVWKQQYRQKFEVLWLLRRAFKVYPLQDREAVIKLHSFVGRLRQTDVRVVSRTRALPITQKPLSQGKGVTATYVKELQKALEEEIRHYNLPPEVPLKQELSTKKSEAKESWARQNLIHPLMVANIQSSLSPGEAHEFGLVSRAFFEASKTGMFQQRVNLLAKYVSSGNQKKAEKLIRQTPKEERARLLSSPASGNLRDFFGRNFKNMSAFQYTLWALDGPMRKMLMKYMTREQISQQLKAYAAKPAGEHGRHFDFFPLLQALKRLSVALKKLYEMMQYYTEPREQAKFKEQIAALLYDLGSAQGRSTIEIINQYCHPLRTFEAPRSSFESASGGLEAEERGVEVSIKRGGGRELVKLSSPQLLLRDLGRRTLVRGGVDDYMNDCFAIASLDEWMELVNYDWIALHANHDLAAVAGLAEARILDYNKLIEEYAPELEQLSMPKPPAEEKLEPPEL